ncbi:hypothetical protein STAFG_8712 [Streptomyces afghaniensis 772]|uniref:Uncharacterized protein n=1 Tax=Streptomyces afghaniensis 772 TaxID=1283301 RepID=S4MLA1_9ACTN|nr:hypothetical protein STAFG_8712 [Streptomyces afghaniensis 772]
MPGEFDDVEPVAADLAGPAGVGVAGQIAAGDVEAGGLRVAGREQGPLQYQRALVLAPVEAGVVDADGGAGGEFDGQVPVAVAERLAALRTGELHEPDDGVVGDHRHGERGLHEPAVLAGDGLRAGRAQGVRAGRVERVVVDGADRDGHAGAGEGRVGDGTGEGHPAQFGAAVGEPGRGLVADQQALVEVDGGQIAEAGHDDVEELPGRGLQVEGVADAGAGLVQQGEVAPGGGGLAGGGAARGDVRAEPGDADRPARTAVHAIEVDGPVAALVGARHEARDVHVRDGVAGLQHTAQRCGDPLRLAALEVVVDALAAVVVRLAAEDGREPVVGAADPQVGVDQQETERGLTENGLRSGEVGLDAAQRADVDDDADGGLLAVLGARRHDVHLGEPLASALPLGVLRRPEGHHAGPLAAVEDLRHLAHAPLAQARVDERLDGVHADGAVRGDAEEVLRAQAPLVDQPVGADGEGRDLDVVVDGAGGTALPHGVPGLHPVGRERTSHRGGQAVRGHRPRARRRVLGLRGLRWYLAHANRPLQLTASGTGHRGRLPAVSSTTVPHNTVFTITARSRWFSVRTVRTLPVF